MKITEIAMKIGTALKKLYRWTSSSYKNALVAVPLSAAVIVLIVLFFKHVFPMLALAVAVIFLYHEELGLKRSVQPPTPPLDNVMCYIFGAYYSVFVDLKDRLIVKPPIDIVDIMGKPPIITKHGVRMLQIRLTLRENEDVSEHHLEMIRRVINERMAQRLYISCDLPDIPYPVPCGDLDHPWIVVDGIRQENERLVLDVVWANNDESCTYLNQREIHDNNIRNHGDTRDGDF
jgi:hypothetical protein